MKQLIRFFLVGGGTAGIQFFILFLCLYFGMDYTWGAVIAYVGSILCHYTLNRYFTFEGKGRPNFGEISRYLAMIALNGLLTVRVTVFSVEVLGYNAYIGTVLAIMVTVGITFLMSRYWVFVYREEV